MNRQFNYIHIIIKITIVIILYMFYDILYQKKIYVNVFAIVHKMGLTVTLSPYFFGSKSVITDFINIYT